MKVSSKSTQARLYVNLTFISFEGAAGGWRHGGGGEDRSTNPRRHPWRVPPSQQNNTAVTAQVGGTARIRCYTHFLADEMVRVIFIGGGGGGGGGECLLLILLLFLLLLFVYLFVCYCCYFVVFFICLLFFL
ncbi:hypothetical protein E2C01_082934 [Portunus trituberculatus]|uniref:Uncharacterized protein n=1 Tax=Portunus trituberculatus TaxID=210409 RepID=A0A5B7J6F3_PORTR|nr:hypothetical protein [Portunus trituberculatus]